MRVDILMEVQRLRDERRPFALATVVAAHQPTSGTAGARAIILPDGQIEGWIGGHCARPTVVRQGLAALHDGTSRLVVISSQVPPGADAADATSDAESGVVRMPMLCAGQGELQVFIEPFLPRIELVVIGDSPVARALVRLGAVLDFAVWACDPTADMEGFPDADRLVPDLEALKPLLSPRSYVVVATIGDYDEEAAQTALASRASYVGLVAGKKRFAAVTDYLKEQGLPPERLALLKRPKGLAGTALVPNEIAFSVLAELLEVRRQRVGLSDAEGLDLRGARAEAADPICGMTVDVATARHTSERDGQTYYFCCAGCKATFDAS
jgi:xanthine dehydrogenase accessory factor